MNGSDPNRPRYRGANLASFPQTSSTVPDTGTRPGPYTDHLSSITRSPFSAGAYPTQPESSWLYGNQDPQELCPPPEPEDVWKLGFTFPSALSRPAPSYPIQDPPQPPLLPTQLESSRLDGNQDPQQFCPFPKHEDTWNSGFTFPSALSCPAPSYSIQDPPQPPLLLTQPESSRLDGNQDPQQFGPFPELEDMWNSGFTFPSALSRPAPSYPIQDPPQPPLRASNLQLSLEQHSPSSKGKRGPMVPQKRYKPLTSSDRRRHVEEVNLEPPINFYSQNPNEEGIHLGDALHGRFARLVARDAIMFQERGTSISIRINWPGYQPWSRQIPTRDFRNPPGPITRAKLAKNVAKAVARFISDNKERPMEDDGDPAWAVGPKIDVSDLVLMRLDHVSKGAWQAQFQLLNPRP